MMRREVALIGTARPRPTPATAVLMPITRPWESARAPPELPGFKAASVWMTTPTMREPRAVRLGTMPINAMPQSMSAAATMRPRSVTGNWSP